MRIETEKVLTPNGQPGYKVLAVYALPENELPGEYLTGAPYAKGREGMILTLERGNIIVGDVFSKKAFDEQLEYPDN